MFLQRIRMRFRKMGALCAISHLDLMRAFERVLRRSALPLRMSEGYNPHPRISFPAPLAVGIEGTDEVMEFDLADWVPITDIGPRVRAQLPEGIELLRLELGSPRSAAQAAEVEYRYRPNPPGALSDDSRWSPAAVESVMARTEISVQRKRKGKTKRVDIRPLILSMRHDHGVLIARFRAGNAGSVHPEEILATLGFDLPGERPRFGITRTQVLLEDDQRSDGKEAEK